LAKYLIIQVELDHLTPNARRELLSSTRDRLKMLSFYDEMREGICAALSADENLVRLNEERKERLLSRHSEAEQAKMRERFARLMERFRAGVDVTAKGKGANAEGRKTSETGSREPLEPLPTKDEPSFIKIANTQKPIPVRLDRHALIRLESDAPDDYLSKHVHAKLTIGSEPEGTVGLETRSDFHGGRARLTVKPSEKVRAGDTATLTVFLFTPSDKSFSAKATVKFESAEDKPTAGSSSKAKVQVPTPIPVYKPDWPEYGWNEDSVAEVKDDGKDTKIFVNMDNKHLNRLLHSGSYQEVGVTRMRNSFLLYVAFYSWAKYAFETTADIDLDGEEFEEYQAKELDRVAQTGAYSISSASRLEDEEIEALRTRFSGSQKERMEKAMAEQDKRDEKKPKESAPSDRAAAKPEAPKGETAKSAAPKTEGAEKPAEPPLGPEECEARFRAEIDLRVAKIVKIERHPQAEKLYIETVDTGDGERVIVSGLVPHYKEEELLGKHIVLVSNLKPAKLRGVVSNGMLLAASNEGVVEVLFAPHAAPGSRVTLEGESGSPASAPGEITIDRFFSVPIRAEDGVVKTGNKAFTVDGVRLVTERVKTGEVG